MNALSSHALSGKRLSTLVPPKRGQRRQEIIYAVLDLAARNDPGRITTQMVADQVGLTHGALFRHFATKEAMMTAVVATVAELLPRAVESALQKHPTDALRALEAAFLAHVDFLVEHPGAPRVMISEMQHGSSSEASALAAGLLRRYTALLAEQMAQGVRRKQLRPRLEAAAAAGVFLGAIQGLMLQSLMAGKTDGLQPRARATWKVLKNAFQPEKGRGHDQ